MKNLTKKLTPILAAVLVVLSLVFGIPMGDDAAETTPPTGDTSASATLDTGASTDDSTAPSDSTPTEDNTQPEESTRPEEDTAPIAADGTYTSKEDVALYIHTYGCLPGNFLTKNEARDLGWEGGGLEKYAPGMCIGGDRFGNYEGLLPDAPGRIWTECDIDTLGKSSRGAKRIVFSNDGLIYYTDDHYESFTQLYGEDQ